MSHRTVYGKDKLPLTKAQHGELVTAWFAIFRQKAPAEASSKALRNTLVATTSVLRLDFEIMKQRGLAFDN